MRSGAGRRSWRVASLGVTGILIAVLTGCTSRGGGQLPPQGPFFTGSASFGFSHSCEDKGGINPQPGRLRIELAYSDKGSNPVGSSFGIHGTADTLDPVLESTICSGSNPPEPSNEVIFLGRFRPTTSPPAGFLKECADRETSTPCRFEVIVRDNDRNLAPSAGDFFSIKLSTATALSSELDPATVFYARAGYLSSGNLTVD